MVLTSYLVAHPLCWNKLPTKQNQFPCVSDDIHMWILRKGSGHGRKFKNCKRKNIVVVSSFWNTPSNRPTETPLLSYLGLSAHGSNPARLYKAPGCHYGRHSMSHPIFLTCFSCSHLRATSRWDSWDSGMLLRVPLALPPAGEPTESTFWPGTVPLSLASLLCLQLPAAAGVLLLRLCAHGLQTCRFRNWFLRATKVRFCIRYSMPMASGNVLSIVITLCCQTFLLNWILALITKR